jgi:TonB-dependent SusC/RagA subfamily outer membrane receptor
VTISATGASERQREMEQHRRAHRRLCCHTMIVSGVNDLSVVARGERDGHARAAPADRVAHPHPRLQPVSLSNEPLIIIDGIRSVSDPGGSTISVGGQNPTRLDDLNPDDIENIEIIKGPAAAALYGTAAANGVVQITTKRGKSGRTRWSFFGDGGRVEDVFDYPANFARVGTRPNGARTTACTLLDVAAATCTPKTDSLVQWTPIEDASVFVRGWRSNYGLSAAGGTDRVQYYLGGDYTREQGVYSNNSVRKQGVRANVGGQLSSSSEFSAKLGYNQLRARIPQNDNNDLSPIANSVLGSAFDNPTTRGYFLYPPALFNQIGVDQNVERVTASLNGTWRPLSWLSLTGLGGVDYAGRSDQAIIPRTSSPVPTTATSARALPIPTASTHTAIPRPPPSAPPPASKPTPR